MVTVAASKGADSSKLTKPGSLVKEAAGERPEKQKARTGQRCVREATKNDLFLGDALLSILLPPAGLPWRSRQKARETLAGPVLPPLRRLLLSLFPSLAGTATPGGPGVRSAPVDQTERASEAFCERHAPRFSGPGARVI
jgi:hypothetical protein